MKPIHRQICENIALAVRDRGGCAYYVGGCVRDELMGRSSLDTDVEIHGIAPGELGEILSSIAPSREVGKSFGIYTLGGDGSGIDVALPRREVSTGEGHRDYEIEIDPWAGPAESARRRDFTVNAMMKDVLSGEVLDFFGGREDLSLRRLRHVDAASFVSDPLRVFRAAQFCARFGFTLDDETVSLCRDMSVAALSAERVREELFKALEGSVSPSVFFDVLVCCGHLREWFGEVESLRGVPQDPLYHPEGDVYTHTMMVLNAAADLKHRSSDPVSFMLSALCHDLGKADTTSESNGRIHAYSHEDSGVRFAGALLERLRCSSSQKRYVLNMVKLHMKPAAEASAASKLKKTNRMFYDSVCPEDLVLLAEADYRGCGGTLTYFPHGAFLRDRLARFRQIMAEPPISGRELIENGAEPGEAFGEYLDYALKLKLAGEDRASQLRQTLAYIRKRKFER
ncbi:MAG: HD domain-containing protein [Eubacteriaceae bacterium]|nr:HD domain-containing protein [Eubacteriaceae bacterium]